MFSFEPICHGSLRRDQFNLLVTVRGLGFCVLLENEDQMKNKKIGPQSQFVYNYLVLLGLS